MSEATPPIPHEPSADEVRREQLEQDLSLVALGRFHDHLASGEQAIPLEEVMKRLGLTEDDLIIPDRLPPQD